jgi:hypothetical protein
VRGIILNLLEEAITAEHGDTWGNLLDASGPAGASTSLGNYYPEDVVTHLVDAGVECALAGGMTVGAAAHSRERASTAHESCMFDGADHCTLRVPVEAG